MRSMFLVALACCVLAHLAGAQNIDVMPMPAKVTMGEGQLAIDRSFSVAVTGRTDTHLQRAVDFFLENLKTQTGMLVFDGKAADPTKATLTIRSDSDSKEVQELGEDESYELKVTHDGATLIASTTLGVMRGLQTFLQLVRISDSGYAVPVLSIEDAPRFPWRGLMIDVSRHFMPMNVLKRNLDGMAAVKLNVFHWHLSDNQGFRVESRRFPKLQLLGSDGQYYTQAEVREIIAYARDRGIRVVPEFDMPGHTTAWFVGYPELASAPGPYEIERKWGVFDPAMDPTQEQTYKFLDEFIGEMAKLFPDQYFHIGGDEVNGKQWDSNLAIRDFKRLHGIKSDEELQTYFVQRVQKIVAKHGKTMVGWDEVLSPASPNSIVIQSWRGQDSLAAAAKQGFRGLLSYGYYLDLNWSAARHYEVDPLAASAANLSPEEKKRILGGEACIWSEYVSPENIDSRIWPRGAAIAERLWSQPDVRDADSMYARMDEVSRKLDFIGLTHNANYLPMLERIAGNRDSSAVRVLADAVEPVKDYAREELAISPATSATPLYRVIDAARPESEIARKADKLVAAFLSGSASQQQTAELRNLFTSWKDNDAKLEPLAESFLLKEVIPISQALAHVGADGLQAMEYLSNHQNAPADWTDEQLAFLKDAAKPSAQLFLAVVPSVERLVRATGPQAASKP